MISEMATASLSAVSILKGRNSTWKRATEPEKSVEKSTTTEAETTTATSKLYTETGVIRPSGALPAASLDERPTARDPSTTKEKGSILKGRPTRQLQLGNKQNKKPPKRQKFHRPPWNAAKRIRLDTNTNAHGSGEDATTITAASTNQQEVEQNEEKKAKASGAGGGLTSFAYRHTNHRGSNAVVRVPNHQKARVCGQFLRGLPCKNERCRDRHDLPNQECAMPYCSYFQQQGMCLRTDCPFRHVKVNPRATQCPTFAALGYCEDVDCAMKHEKPKSQQQKQHDKKSRNGYDLPKMSWHKKG